MGVRCETVRVRAALVALLLASAMGPVQGDDRRSQLEHGLLFGERLEALAVDDVHHRAIALSKSKRGKVHLLDLTDWTSDTLSLGFKPEVLGLDSVRGIALIGDHKGRLHFLDMQGAWLHAEQIRLRHGVEHIAVAGDAGIAIAIGKDKRRISVIDVDAATVFDIVT